MAARARQAKLVEQYWTKPTAPISEPPVPWPASRVEMRPLDKLRPYERNARTHPPEQVAQIAASMREFGFTIPALVDETGLLIAGHGRVLAAQRLVDEGRKEFERIPVMVAAGWTDAQRRAYTIADNRLAETSTWDLDLLRLELGDLRALDFDLPTIGWNDVELKELFSPPNKGQVDPDDVPEPPAVPVSQPGDVWLLGKHRLLCGDATDKADVDRLLGAARPNLMVTDPPYGVEYDPQWRHRVGINASKGKRGEVLNDDRADWRAAWELFPGDVAYIWHAGRYASVVQTSIEAAGFDIRTQIIWAKDRMVLGRGDYHWQHEPCWHAVRSGKRGAWAGDRSQTTLWLIKARDDAGHGHGTQKPVECMRRPIINNSRPGDAVYEPFSGSGTTIIACEMEGRVCYAIELSPAYVDVAVKRWETFTGKSASREKAPGSRRQGIGAGQAQSHSQRTENSP
jgi:DNA modification methylase